MSSLKIAYTRAEAAAPEERKVKTRGESSVTSFPKFKTHKSIMFDDFYYLAVYNKGPWLVLMAFL